MLCPYALPFCLTVFVFVTASASLPLGCLERHEGNSNTQDLKQLIPQFLESIYL